MKIKRWREYSYGKETKQGFSEGQVSDIYIEKGCLSLDWLINP